MHITDAGAECLLVAIGEQAAKDYKRSYKKRLKYLAKENTEMAVLHEERMNEIERFFKGTWFKALFPRLKGKQLFEALKSQTRKEYLKEMDKKQRKKEVS